MTPRHAIVLFLSLVALGFAAFWPIHFAVDAEFWGRLMDAGHLPMFGYMALVFYFTLPAPGVRTEMRLFRAFGLTVIAAAAVELFQPYFGRTQSWTDLFNGALGGALALIGLMVWQPAVTREMRAAHTLVTLALAWFVLAPALAEVEGMYWRHTHFPLLGDFESDAELHLWEAVGGSEHSATRVVRTREQVERGHYSLLVRTGKGSWAGVNFSAGEQDWSRYKTLRFAVFNPGERFRLWLRVDDNGDCRRSGSRFDSGFNLANGWNQIIVTVTDLEHGPQNRRLNLCAIRRLVLFTGADVPARRFMLDNVRLEL